MSFPLIVQPSPTQQLAETIARIRAGIDARSQAALDRRVAEQQLTSAKVADSARMEALELDRQRLADARRAQDIEAKNQLADQSLAQARFQATLQQTAIENRRAEAARKDAQVRLLAQLLPEGVTASLGRLQAEVAGNKALAGTPARPTLEQDILAAQTASRPGLQGSAIRAPRFGMSGGVIADPGTLNFNQPAAPRSGAFGHIAERTAIGAGLMERVVNRANLLYGANPQNAFVPASGDIGAAIAEKFLGHGAGSRVADRVRNIGASQQQAEFRGLREQFKHSMAVFFPRVSIALMDNLADSYFPVGGERGPAAAAKLAALNDVWRVVQEVRAGRASHASLAQALAAGAGPTAGAAAILEAAGEDDATGGAAAAPTINPRFLR